MMAIGNIDSAYLCKGLCDCLHLCSVSNDPDTMPDAIFRYKVCLSRCLFDRYDQPVQRLVGMIGQEDRSCLHIGHIDMADTVLFLLCTGILMFFDRMVQIIIYRSAGHNAGLTAAIHGQLIQIIAGHLILYKFSGCDPLLQ